MKSRRSIARLGACLACPLLLGGASLPLAMAGPGEWEVSRSASGTGGAKTCLLDAAILTQWEHRNRQCTRVVISSSIDRAQVQYTCVGAGFGTSNVQVLTPRSVKVDTQGIGTDGLPFSYIIHARRVGACQPR